LLQAGIFIILIGGCSRSGKSTLAKHLSANFRESRIDALVLNLDAWVIDVDKRKPDSTVLERYDILEIASSIEQLLKGELISPPVYDPVVRKKTGTGQPIGISNGILVIEGVIALALPELLTKANLRIFVDIADLPRIKRLVSFYRDIKKLDARSYKQLIRAREAEEVPFIKSTRSQADIVHRY